MATVGVKELTTSSGECSITLPQEYRRYHRISWYRSNWRLVQDRARRIIVTSMLSIDRLLRINTRHHSTVKLINQVVQLHGSKDCTTASIDVRLKQSLLLVGIT